MKFYIGGDSWGCGEWNWDIKGDPNTHRGLEQFLIDDGHTVTNNSISGGGNVQSYDQIAKTNPDDYDMFILFQTISIRDNEGWDTLVTWQDFIDRTEELKAEYFKKLGSLPHKICLMGGLEKVYKEEILQYPNLIPLIESIPETLTDGKYVAGTLKCPISIGEVRLNRLNFYDQISKNVDLDVLDDFSDSVDYWNENVSTVARYFQPDGRHPNRTGHRQIYNTLKQYIKAR